VAEQGVLLRERGVGVGSNSTRPQTGGGWLFAWDWWWVWGQNGVVVGGLGWRACGGAGVLKRKGENRKNSGEWGCGVVCDVAVGEHKSCGTQTGGRAFCGWGGVGRVRVWREV